MKQNLIKVFRYQPLRLFRLGTRRQLDIKVLLSVVGVSKDR